MDVMVVNFFHKTFLLQVCDYLDAGRRHLHAGILACFFVQFAVAVDYFIKRQRMSQGDLKVVRVVRRCNFNDAGAELWVYELVGDDR